MEHQRRDVFIHVTLFWDRFATLLRDDPDELVRCIRETPHLLLQAHSDAEHAAFTQWLMQPLDPREVH